MYVSEPTELISSNNFLEVQFFKSILVGQNKTTKKRKQLVFVANTEKANGEQYGGVISLS